MCQAHRSRGERHLNQLQHRRGCPYRSDYNGAAIQASDLFACLESPAICARWHLQRRMHRDRMLTHPPHPNYRARSLRSGRSGSLGHCREQYECRGGEYAGSQELLRQSLGSYGDEILRLRAAGFFRPAVEWSCTWSRSRRSQRSRNKLEKRQLHAYSHQRSRSLAGPMGYEESESDNERQSPSSLHHRAQRFARPMGFKRPESD
jgi:hypothetical protein